MTDTPFTDAQMQNYLKALELSPGQLAHNSIMRGLLGIGASAVKPFNLEYGRQLQQNIEDTFPVRHDQPVQNFVGQVVGSTAAIVPALLTTGPAAPFVSGGTIGVYGLSGAGDMKERIHQYEETTGNNISTVGEAMLMTVGGAIEAGGEAIGYHMLKAASAAGKSILPAAERTLFENLASSIGGRIGIGAVTEGAEEAVQDFASDVTASTFQGRAAFGTPSQYGQSFLGGAIGGSLLGPITRAEGAPQLDKINSDIPPIDTTSPVQEAAPQQEVETPPQEVAPKQKPVSPYRTLNESNRIFDPTAKDFGPLGVQGPPEPPSLRTGDFKLATKPTSQVRFTPPEPPAPTVPPKPLTYSEIKSKGKELGQRMINELETLPNVPPNWNQLLQTVGVGNLAPKSREAIFNEADKYVKKWMEQVGKKPVKFEDRPQKPTVQSVRDAATMAMVETEVNANQVSQVLESTKGRVAEREDLQQELDRIDKEYQESDKKAEDKRKAERARRKAQEKFWTKKYESERQRLYESLGLGESKAVKENPRVLSDNEVDNAAYEIAAVTRATNAPDVMEVVNQSKYKRLSQEQKERILEKAAPRINDWEEEVSRAKRILGQDKAKDTREINRIKKKLNEAMQESINRPLSSQEEGRRQQMLQEAREDRQVLQDLQDVIDSAPEDIPIPAMDSLVEALTDKGKDLSKKRTVARKLVRAVKAADKARGRAGMKRKMAAWQEVIKEFGQNRGEATQASIINEWVRTKEGPFTVDSLAKDLGTTKEETASTLRFMQDLGAVFEDPNAPGTYHVTPEARRQFQRKTSSMTDESLIPSTHPAIHAMIKSISSQWGITFQWSNDSLFDDYGQEVLGFVDSIPGGGAIVTLSPRIAENTIGHEVFHKVIEVVGWANPDIRAAAKFFSNNPEMTCDAVGTALYAKVIGGTEMHQTAWVRAMKLFQSLMQNYIDVTSPENARKLALNAVVDIIQGKRAYTPTVAAKLNAQADIERDAYTEKLVKQGWKMSNQDRQILAGGKPLVDDPHYRERKKIYEFATFRSIHLDNFPEVRDIVFGPGAEAKRLILDAEASEKLSAYIDTPNHLAAVLTGALTGKALNNIEIGAVNGAVEVTLERINQAIAEGKIKYNTPAFEGASYLLTKMMQAKANAATIAGRASNASGNSFFQGHNANAFIEAFAEQIQTLRSTERPTPEQIEAAMEAIESIAPKDINRNYQTKVAAIASISSLLGRPLTKKEKDYIINQPGNVITAQMMVKFYEKFSPPRPIEGVTNVLFNGLLSGAAIPKNLLLNGVKMFASSGEMVLSGVLDKTLSTITMGRYARKRYVRENITAFQKLYKGLLEGTVDSAKYFYDPKIADTHGTFMNDIGVAQAEIWNKIADRSGKFDLPIRAFGYVMNMPMRAMVAGDIAFRAGYYNDHLARKFFREAMALKFKYNSPAFWKYQIDRMNNLTNADKKEAYEMAAAGVFMGKPGMMLRGMKSVLHAADRDPVGAWVAGLPIKMFVPFVHTLAKVFEWGYRRIPVVGLASGYRDNLTDILARQIMGTMITGLVVGSIWDDDEVIGAIPENKAERDAFWRANKLPWSVKVGERYISLENDPYSLVWKSAIILRDTLKSDKLTGDQASELFKETAYKVRDMFVSTSFVEGGLKALVDKGVEKKVSQIPASFVPFSGFWRAASRSYEAAMKGYITIPERNKPSDYVTDPIRQVFDLGELPPRLNVWGEEVHLPSTFMREWLPYKLWSLGTDKVEEALLDLGIYPGMPSKQFKVRGKEVDLSNDEYRAHTLVYGKMLKEMFSNYVNSAQYEYGSNEARTKTFSRLQARASQYARAVTTRNLGIGSLLQVAQ